MVTDKRKQAQEATEPLDFTARFRTWGDVWEAWGDKIGNRARSRRLNEFILGELGRAEGEPE